MKTRTIKLNKQQIEEAAVEASEIELPPGDWPEQLLVADEEHPEGWPFVLQFKGLDASGTFAVYASLAFSLTVYNT